jgi:hypothetical protein
VNWKGSQLIISIFIVGLRASCGMLFSLGLAYVGLCLVASREFYATWWVGGKSLSAVVWKMVPLYLMWCIWNERNARYFEDTSRNIEDLIHFFLYTLFTWTAGWLAPLVISFLDFLIMFSFSFSSS